MRKSNNRDCAEHIYQNGHLLRPGEAAATWILALHGRTAYLFHWESDGALHRLVPGCDCAIDHSDIDHIEPYLEAAVATGKFQRMILAGSSEALLTLHQRLSQSLHSRVIHEVTLPQFMPSDLSTLREALESKLAA